MPLSGPRSCRKAPSRATPCLGEKSLQWGRRVPKCVLLVRKAVSRNGATQQAWGPRRPSQYRAERSLKHGSQRQWHPISL